MMLLLLPVLLLGVPAAKAKKEEASAPSAIPTAARATSPQLKNGDRVVFLGDSITVAHTSMRYVEMYLKMRYPDIQVTFINSGIGGHTVYDALHRFDTDVAAYQPTVVVVNFGMNDAGYPPEAEGYAFEKNMTALFDRLATVKSVRLVVWADTTPFDTHGLAGRHKNVLREQRIEELCRYAHDEGQKRGHLVVDWHDPLKRSISSWRAARPYEEKQLLPDRVHPAQPAHAVMAAQLLGALGYDLSPSTITGAYDGTTVTLQTKQAKQQAAWDGKGPLVVDVKDAAAPLLFAASPKDAVDLAAPELSDLRRLVLKVSGMPAGRYEAKLGDVVVGKYTHHELAAGVDLMANAIRPVVVPPTNPAPPEQRPTLASCSSTSGNPFQRDFDCLYDLLLEKDALRVTMRHEKTRTLPDYVPGYLDRFWGLTNEWIVAVDSDVQKKAQQQKQKQKLLTITPAP